MGLAFRTGVGNGVYLYLILAYSSFAVLSYFLIQVSFTPFSSSFLRFLAWVFF
jgi:hypothetical protein